MSKRLIILDPSTIDFPLLKEQKDYVYTLIVDSKVTPETISALEGILSLLDLIQDTALGQGVLTEEEVFGSQVEAEREFIHPDLDFDYKTDDFEKGKIYALVITKTDSDPDNYTLNIEDTTYGIGYNYHYDHKPQAEKDKELFLQLFEIAE